VKYALKDGLLKVASESIITEMNGMIEPILTRSKIAVMRVAMVTKASCNFLFTVNLSHKLLKESIKLSLLLMADIVR